VADRQLPPFSFLVTARLVVCAADEHQLIA
jgi:hypothetical protein